MEVLIGLLIAVLGAVSQGTTSGDADAILEQLSNIRLDKKQIHSVRDITLRRDVLSIALNRGVIAFLEPVLGKVTGAVFIGSGEIVAIPPDAIEKQQVYKFTGTPVLNEAFDTAIFRFTDATYEEIRKEISQHAVEDVSPEDAAQFDTWDSIVAGRAKFLNLRLLADFLEPAGRPMFLGELKSDKRNWFDVVFDLRLPEEVSAFQVHDSGGVAVADVWASFNQRSEARNPEAVAHENKSPTSVVSYEIEATTSDQELTANATLRLKGSIDGARVLNFDLAPSLRVSAVRSDTGETMPFYQYPNATTVTVVLPRALKVGEELTLRFDYAGTVTGRQTWYPNQGLQDGATFKSNIAPPIEEALPVMAYLDKRVLPASYHDHWLIEGLARYIATMSDNTDGPQQRAALEEARTQLTPVESAGAIWLGPRLASTVTPGGYRAASSKGLWVIHMIRTMLRQDSADPDAKFMAMLREFVTTHGGKTASTWDFQHLAEKYANESLDWFFDQWVFATGVPTYTVDYKVQPSGDVFIIEGTIKQSDVPDGFTMPVPIYADDEFLGRVTVTDAENDFRFRVTKKPERIVIDPERNILRTVSQ